MIFAIESYFDVIIRNRYLIFGLFEKNLMCRCVGATGDSCDS